jgi:hypothetical protein
MVLLTACFAGAFFVKADVGSATAIKTVDNRDYTLTVASAHGTPVPTIGTHSNYCWQSTVTCSVDSAVSAGGTNYTCTGWTGTGSIPASGTTHTTGPIILNEVASTLAWQWTANKVSNVTVTQTPGTKQVVINYDIVGDTPTVTVSLVVKSGSTLVPTTSITGHVGPSVAVGTGRIINWDAGADWNGNVGTLAFTVTVADGVPGMPVGGDPTAVSWVVVNDRWVKNTYANGDITMSDRTTGLMWPYNASLGGRRTWFDAMSYCDNLTYAGHADWRLPYVNAQDGSDGPVRPRELEEMFSQQSLFSGVQAYHYWSGTSNAGDTNYAWRVYMYWGQVHVEHKTYDAPFVWPVRGGQVDVGSATAIKTVDNRDYTLAVASAHGSPTPAPGTHTYAWHSTVTASVEASVAESGTTYTCTGWTGTGSIPASGTTHTTGPIVLNTVASSITWQWEAQPNTITLHPGAHGSIPGANSGASYMTNITHGAAFTPPKPVADAGWIFIGWNPTIPATITGDVMATARYAKELLGSGTETDPYRISSEVDFEAFGSAPVYWGRGIHTRLDTSLDFDPDKHEGRVFSTALVAPDAISDNEQFDGAPFAGIFNGNGHTISNITIISPAEGNDYLGLFGSIDSSGIVRDISVENININGEQWILLNGGSGSTWNRNVGSVSGHNRGLLGNCHATGSIIVKMGSSLGGVCGKNEQGTISNCTAHVSVAGGGYNIHTGGSSNLGGLCGFNMYGSISRCFATGNVSTGAHGDDIGGFCGENYNYVGGGNGLISHCYATGDVSGGWGNAGGFIGCNQNRVENCYATGNVSAGQNIGGFCGDNYWGTIVNSYSTGAASGNNQGGFCGVRYRGTAINCFWDTEASGLSSSADGVGKTTGEMQDSSTFLDAGWDFVRETTNGDESIWSIIDNYPVLAWTTEKWFTIYSEHGSDCPVVESIPHYWGDEITYSVNSPYTQGDIRYVCTGWNGTGSVPTSGWTTNVSFSITNDSSIVWNWTTNYWLEAETNRAGRVSGGDDWVLSGSRAVLTALASEGYRFDHWALDGTPINGSTEVLEVLMDAAHTATAHFVVLDLPEALDNWTLSWTTGGGANWMPQVQTCKDGVDAVQTETLADKSECWLQASVEGKGTVSFWWKVSSEENYDLLNFSVDGTASCAPLSGEQDWRKVSVHIDSLGSHVLRWTYAKDKNTTGGQDCGWLDQVVWTSDYTGFALWANGLGLSGDAVALFGQDRNGDGVPNGFEYAFGDNLTPGLPLLNIRMVNGRPVVETPEPDASTAPYVNVRVLASTNLIDWNLPVVPATDTTGKPSSRAWHEPEGARPEKAFFKLEAELK